MASNHLNLRGINRFGLNSQTLCQHPGPFLYSVLSVTDYFRAGLRHRPLCNFQGMTPRVTAPVLPYLSCSMELQLMPLRPPVLHASAKRSMVRWSSSELIHPLWLTFIQSTPDTTKIGLAGMKKGQGQVIPCTAPAQIMGMRSS